MLLKTKVRCPYLGHAAIMLACGITAVPAVGLAVEPVGSPRVTLTYRSVFSDYQKLENFSEPKSNAWRLANDAVEKVGGWRQYAKEAARADAPPTVPTIKPAMSPAPPPTPAPPLAPTMHGHHGKKP